MATQPSTALEVKVAPRWSCLAGTPTGGVGNHSEDRDRVWTAGQPGPAQATCFDTAECQGMHPTDMENPPGRQGREKIWGS